MPPFLIQLVIVLIIVGLVFWLLTLLPIDPKFIMIIRTIMIVFVVIWLIYLLAGFLPQGRLGR
jgi:VIT1/CCC1 family predicted Fe2+/Mn2+ transporter